ncbi:MAG: TatD family hydrolase [Motiliproteus sp.]
MLIDSHCHLDRLNLSAYDGDLKVPLQQAHENGVDKILCVATDMARFPDMLEMINRYENVYGSVGVHPMSDEITTITTEQLISAAQSEKIIAIGETGLDYFYQPDTIDAQKLSFIKHLQVSAKLKKPVIVHTRDAKKDTLDIISQHGNATVGGVLHCFTEDWDMAEQAILHNYWISFSGIITFRNADPLRDVVRQVPLERILVETDAPYLTPAPFRGKPNEPKFVKRVAECVAEVKGISYEEVARVTTENFYRLFSTA